MNGRVESPSLPTVRDVAARAGGTVPPPFALWRGGSDGGLLAGWAGWGRVSWGRIRAGSKVVRHSTRGWCSSDPAQSGVTCLGPVRVRVVILEDVKVPQIAKIFNIVKNIILFTGD